MLAAQGLGHGIGGTLNIPDEKTPAEAQLQLANAELGLLRARLEANEIQLVEREQKLQELAEAESRFRDAMTHSATGMALVAPRGQALQFNDTASKIVGYSVEELLAMTLRDLVHPDDLAADELHARRLLLGEIDSYRLESRFLRKDGSIIWVVRSVSLARDAVGVPKYFVCEMSDISARKQAEAVHHATFQQLNDANRFLVMAEELANVGHWRVDLVRNEILWSEQVYRIHGVLPGTWKPDLETAVNFYHPDDRPVIASHLQRALETGNDYACELRIIRQDGETRDVSSVGHCERAADGSICAIFGVFEDVTARKDAERDLARLNAHLHLATEAGRIGIWENRISENKFSADQATRQMYGLSKPLAELGNEDWEGAIHPDDRTVIRAALQRFKSGEQRYEVEYRVLWPDGTILHMLGRGTLVRDEAGRPARMVGTVWDITELRCLAVKLAEEKERAEAANRAKSNFLAMMSHEIRTPMNGIMGMNALLLATDLTPHQRNLAETVRYSADSLLAIIDQILDMSKLEAGRIELDEIEFDLGVLFQMAVDLLGSKAEQKGLALTTNLAPACHGSFRGDPTRLRQIVLNLISNAIKFTERGSITIVATGTESGVGALKLRVETRDTGIGVDDDAKRKLFQPFAQADGSITRRFGGTGLGLSICKKLVEQMGGQIGVADRPGGGSVFWFEIVLQRAAPPIRDSAPPRRRPEARNDTPSVGRILLVEDNRINRDLANFVLGAAGHSVVVAVNGLEAVAAFHQDHFDVILMDIEMPELDGLSATQQIRELEQATGTRVPIIAMTANAMQDDQRRCREAGMDDYLSKPIDVGIMQATIARWMAPEIAPSEPE